MEGKAAAIAVAVREAVATAAGREVEEMVAAARVSVRAAVGKAAGRRRREGRWRGKAG